MIRSFKSRKRRDSRISAVSLETYRKEAQSIDFVETAQGSQFVGDTSTHFSGALYQAHEKSEINFIVAGVGRSHGQVWASITSDRRGFVGGEHFKKIVSAALKSQKLFEDMTSIANFLIKQDAIYRKTSLRGVGLFVGTTLSGVLVDMKGQVLYKIRRGSDALLAVDASYEETFAMFADITPTERTTVKFPDYEIIIEKCSLVSRRLILILASPAIWELVSDTRAAVKLRHIHHTDSTPGNSSLAAQLVTIALQQVMRQSAKSSDRRYYTLDSMESLQQLKLGQMSKNRHNVYQRLRGDVHGDLSAAVVTLDGRSEVTQTANSLSTAALAGNRTQRRRVSRWLTSVPSLNSIRSLETDAEESESTAGSPTFQHNGPAATRWGKIRAHFWGEVDVKRDVRHKWVVLLYEALSEAQIGRDDGILKPYVRRRYREMSRLRQTFSAHQLGEAQ